MLSNFFNIAWCKIIGSLPLLICIPLIFNCHAEETQITKTQNSTKNRPELYFIAYMENQNVEADLEKWTDQKMINELSKIDLTDNDMKALYVEFKNTVVSPPDPGSYKEYGMVNGEKILEDVIQLGRKIHNMLFALSDEDIEKYGNLLHAMRDVLYIDSKSISFVIKHDNSRDVYWHGLYAKTVKKVDEVYFAIFNNRQTK